MLDRLAPLKDMQVWQVAAPVVTPGSSLTGRHDGRTKGRSVEREPRHSDLSCCLLSAYLMSSGHVSLKSSLSCSNSCGETVKVAVCHKQPSRAGLSHARKGSFVLPDAAAGHKLVASVRSSE